MLLTATLFSLLALAPSWSDASPTLFSKRYSGALIRSYRTNTCLTITPGTQLYNGAPLRVGDCSTATRWDINPGSGSVIVTGTNYALDAGVNPHNNVPAKIWQSYPGAPQQTWYLTPDNRIAITGGNQCLDEGDNGPQTYQCTTGNTNQIWYVDASKPPASSSKAPASSSKAPASSSKAPASSSKAPASSTKSTPHSSSTKASASSTPTSPAQKRYTLRWKGNGQGYCASTQGPFESGTVVNLEQCDNDLGQQFIYLSNGLIQLADTSAGTYCLDAGYGGVTPQNGANIYLAQCQAGVSHQTWTFPSGPNGLFVNTNNQCLDVNNQDNVNTQLQTWTCSQPDPQQQFIFVAI